MAQQGSAGGAERRVFTRLPYRVPCEFTYEGFRLAGIVTDISARGLFVETSSRIPTGTEIRFVLRDPRGSFEVIGRVMRERRSHRSARQVRANGLGVQLDVIPEPFFRLLVELGLG
jgi:PilZ domain